ncbi:MAG TPA: response regulator transcription factor [Ignavibacteriaceae bacterium]|nr:response regulator transcription factor [Ignavibacteriaceae bacterium]
MIINVGIVEDNKKIREGLAALIDGSEGFKCNAVHETAEEALKKFPYENPDIVLMDINLPGISGIECLIKLKEILPDVQVMMLTVYENDDLIFKSLVAGATGYILKRTPPAELLEAIKEIHNGGSPMSDQIARKVVQAFQQMGKSSKETENISERESEILDYLSKGYYDKEIADKLFLSVKTVRTHLRNIYKKLHVRSRTEAVLKYLQKSF